MSNRIFILGKDEMDTTAQNVISPSAQRTVVLQKEIPRGQIWRLSNQTPFRLAFALKKELTNQTLTSGSAFTVTLSSSPFIKPGSTRMQNNEFSARLYTFADGGTPGSANEVAASRITYNYDSTNTIVWTANASEAGSGKTVVAYYKFGTGIAEIVRQSAGDEVIEDRIEKWAMGELHALNFDEVTSAITLAPREFRGGDLFQIKVLSSVQIENFPAAAQSVWECAIPFEIL